MSPALSVAASLSPGIRQDIGIQVLARPEPVSHIAATHQVSRKFVYQQGAQVQPALDDSFAPSQGDDDVLFHLPVTKNWLYQLILGLVLICHSISQVESLTAFVAFVEIKKEGIIPPPQRRVYSPQPLH